MEDPSSVQHFVNGLLAMMDRGRVGAGAAWCALYDPCPSLLESTASGNKWINICHKISFHRSACKPYEDIH